MAHKKDTSLSDAVAAAVTREELDSIISTALATPNATQRSTHETLILSGVALGVDALSRFSIGALHNQIKEIRSAIAMISEAIEEAGASDELLAFGRKVRQGLVDHVQRQIDLVSAQQAVETERTTGITKDLILSDTPVGELSQDLLAALGMSVSIEHSVPFYGFARHEDPASMKCGCLGCLADYAIMTTEPTTSSLSAGIARYGSPGGLMAAFAAHVITDARSKIEQFADEYGTEQAMTDEAAASATNDILAQFTFGGDGKSGHIAG